MQIIERLTGRIGAPCAAASGRRNRTAPATRGAVIPTAVIFLCMAMADAAPAREAAAPFDTLLAPDMSSDDGRRFMRPEIDTRGGLARFLDIPQIGIERQSSQARLIASESRAWKTFLDKTRIDRLPRSIARSLRDLGQSGADRPRGRAAGPVTKRRIDPAATTAAWQFSQIGLERIAIPQPRPSSDPADGDARPAPVLSFSGWPNDLSFGGRALSGMAAFSLALLAGALAYRHRANTRLSRERALAEKAVYDAIAELPLEKGHDFRAAVSAVLQRVETAYDLSAASVILVQPKTLEVQDVYSHEPQAVLPNGLVEDAVAEIRKHGDDLSDLTLWRYPDPAGVAEASRLEPDAITSVVWRGDRAGAILIAGCRPGRRARATDARTLQVVTQLLAIVIEEHGRPAAMSGDREELAGNLAHEFNNLLMPIMGYAEMAADALNPGSSPRAYVERIQSAGERAKQVIDQMLNFSGRPESAHGSFDVATATAEILSDLKMCVPASTTFRASFPDGPVCIDGSATALQQAVINLCKNASEAMADGGTVTVGVTVIDQSVPRIVTHGQLAAGRYVRVSVADTGPGIPPDNLRQIFDPFFTTRAGEGGTGLGLAMVLRTVKLLNGGLNVRSSPGWGTRFDLFFPCRSEVGTVVPMWATVAAE